jgi:hypothetical protein
MLKKLQGQGQIRVSLGGLDRPTLPQGESLVLTSAELEAIRDFIDRRKLKAKHLTPTKDDGVSTIEGRSVADPGFLTALRKISKSYEQPERYAPRLPTSGGHFRRDLRFLPSRLAFALTVRSAGFNAAATTAVAACGVFFPVMALDAIRIVSVCAATVPDVAAATFSDTIRFNSALFLGDIPAAKKIGHRHHSVMLVSRTAAPRSTANWSGVCRCAMWVKLRSGSLFRTAAMPELFIAASLLE